MKQHYSGKKTVGEVWGQMMGMALVCCFLLASCGGGQRSILVAANASSLPEPSLLIVSDKTGLEWNVAGHLERHFSQQGFLVRNILESDLPRYQDLTGAVVVFLSGTQEVFVTSIDTTSGGSVQKTCGYDMDSAANNRERHLTQQLVDGISGASEMADAVPIAQRIITTLSAYLSEKSL